MKNLPYPLLLLFAFVLLFKTAPVYSQTTWTAYNPPFGDTIGIADIEVLNENVIWAVGVKFEVNDSLYGFFGPSPVYMARTVDGGANWSVTLVPLGDLPFIANMSVIDENTAFISGLDEFGNAKTLKTTDGSRRGPFRRSAGIRLCPGPIIYTLSRLPKPASSATRATANLKYTPRRMAGSFGSVYQAPIFPTLCPANSASTIREMYWTIPYGLAPAMAAFFARKMQALPGWSHKRRCRPSMLYRSLTRTMASSVHSICTLPS